MTRYLLGEELGASRDGALMLALLGEELTTAGHDCSYALRELGRAFPAGLNPPPYQAPVWRGPKFLQVPQIGRHPAKIGGIADMLAVHGLGDPAILRAMVGAWRHILDHVKPDSVIGFVSPALAIACEAEAVRFVMIGEAHLLPPSIRGEWPRSQPLQPPVVRSRDLVDSVNSVRKELGLPAIGAPADILTPGRRCVFGHLAFDPYQASRTKPLIAPPGAAAASGAGDKVVAVLSIEQRNVEDILFGILACDLPAAICVDGAPPAMQHYLESRGAACSWPEAVDAIGAARVVIHQGEPPIGLRAAMAGKPQLLLPTSREECRQMADRIAALGCGRAVDPRRHPIQSMERALRECWSSAEQAALSRGRAEELAVSAHPWDLARLGEPDTGPVA